ncbi:hypothetical protein ACH5RR_006882 [Cinchona calisaya]|uniref:Uncharacterized protein n=1 Tax=Cinchona calisaya TaxID=153742 RepID=A0ABD3AQL0_9GENT
MCSEVLSLGLKVLTQLGKLTPYAILQGCPSVTHLSYVDDTMIFTRGKLKRTYFKHMPDKLQAKVGGWKNNFLSPGGRLAFIKQVLSTIPIHQFAVNEASKSVLKSMVQVLANFFSGNTPNGDRRYWVNWKQCCLPTEEDGLGIRNFQDISHTFYLKLWWRFYSLDSLWAIYMRARYKSLDAAAP